MKVGLIARGENRGLGILTWEFARHMDVERTLLIDMGDLARGFDVHLDRYPGATVVPFDGELLPELAVRDWIEGLDVVYSAETFYDWRVVEWCREAGVATVCHAMPEFYKHDVTMQHLPHPTSWWNPTSWRMDTMPESTRLVPIPVATDRWDVPRGTADGERVRLLHVVGKRAMGDRNGTTEVLRCVPMLQSPIGLQLVAQESRLPSARGVRRGVTVTVTLGGVADYWSLYDADVLVLPRRYGGLSLPVQEAMGAGLAVVMTDAEPQRSTWPVVTVPSRRRGTMPTGAGPVELVVADASALGRACNRLAQSDRTGLQEAQAASRAWAAAHAWTELRALYDAELDRACSLP